MAIYHIRFIQGVDRFRHPELSQHLSIHQGIVRKTVTATPELRAPTPVLVVICTDRRSHWFTAASPKFVVQQVGGFGPVIVADIPVLTGSVNPHGLV